MIFPVILCGGSGERLWPLSRKSYPKQFLEIVGDGSLFQQSVARLSGETNDPIIVTNDNYRFIVRQQLQEITAQEADVIIEPEGKNTAPAILVAALHVASREPSGVMVVMPSDHYIPEQETFTVMIKDAAENIQEGQIICLGVQPSRVETGYGYIKVNDTGKKISKALQFVEKPNLNLAQEYLSDGNYLWNAGIFIVRAGELIDLAHQLQPEMMQQIVTSYKQAKNDLDFLRLDPDSWKKIQEISFDYAFMEKADHIGCMSFAGTWSDLGDWIAVARETNIDRFGNNLIGNAYQKDTRDSILWSDSDDQVLTVLGLENIIAVAMRDAVLVADKSKSQEIKFLIETLKNSGQGQASDHLYEHRPWGYLRTIAKGKNFQVKIINVLPGGKLSLQSHKHRSEHWVVVRGSASVIRGGQEIELKTNESVYINAHQKHQLRNNKDEELEIIEVQTGNYFGEDDVIRFSD